MPPPGRPPEDERLVYGVHPVTEALEADPPKIDRIYVSRESGSRTGRVCRLARERGVPVSHVDRETLKRRAGAGAAHQGVAAVLAAAPYSRVADVLAAGRAAGDRALLVAVEGVDDPRNLGAILRSAVAAGAAGALLATERTVGLTPAAVKTSAGAALRLPVARDPRLPETLRALGSGGWIVAALVAHGGTPPEQLPGGRPTLLLAGGEERGPRAGVLAASPFRVTIPLEGGAESLNVAVALGVVLFDILRRRRAGAKND
jgi:23S rRNA (guanosine2251-2'-O)-methyltransferase